MGSYTVRTNLITFYILSYSTALDFNNHINCWKKHTICASAYSNKWNRCPKFKR